VLLGDGIALIPPKSNDGAIPVDDCYYAYLRSYGGMHDFFTPAIGFTIKNDWYDFRLRFVQGVVNDTFRQPLVKMRIATICASV
jgi:hypothetical protein